MSRHPSTPATFGYVLGKKTERQNKHRLLSPTVRTPGNHVWQGFGVNESHQDGFSESECLGGVSRDPDRGHTPGGEFSFRDLRVVTAKHQNFCVSDGSFSGMQGEGHSR